MMKLALVMALASLLAGGGSPANAQVAAPKTPQVPATLKSLLNQALADAPLKPLPVLTPAETTTITNALGHDFQCNYRAERQEHERPSITLGGSSFNATIDKETGLLVDFHRLGTQDSGVTGDPKINMDTAVANATAFLNRINVPPTGVWALDSKEYHEAGQGLREYDLGWSKTLDGIELPSFISIIVNADTGEVSYYTLVDDPVTVSMIPTLTAADAVAVLAQKEGWTHPITQEAELMVWYKGGYPGPQALMWHVTVANGDAQIGENSLAQAYVEAVTGELVTVMTPAGTVRLTPEMKKKGRAPLPKIDRKALQAAKVPPTVFQLAKLAKQKK